LAQFSSVTPPDYLFAQVKRFLLIAIGVLIAYVGSYAGFRASHIERWDRDGMDYVIFPKNPTLYYLYRPLTYLDARITGMRFHIGPHR
jgi:hypothetical protein